MPRLGHLKSIAAGHARRTLILNFLRDYQDKHGWMPNYREIAAAVGVTSLEVIHRQLELMQQEGSIHHEPSQARAIRVVERAS